MPKLDKTIVESMFSAVKDADLDRMTNLLDMHPSLLNERYFAGKGSWLHVAVMFSRHEVVAPLVSRGLDVDVENKEGLTPLLVATMNKRLPMMQTLLDHGANLHALNRFKETLLYLTASSALPLDESPVLIAKELISRGYEVDRVAQEGADTPLFRAAQRGLVKLARVLLQAGADPEFRNNHGISVIDVARDFKHDEMVAMLEGWTHAHKAHRVVTDADGTGLRPLAFTPGG